MEIVCETSQQEVSLRKTHMGIGFWMPRTESTGRKLRKGRALWMACVHSTKWNTQNHKR
jgi:hypothetical protein